MPAVRVVDVMPVMWRYITRELLLVFVMAALVLLFMGMGGRFIGYMQDAAMGKYSGYAVAVIMLLRMPEFLQLVLPFAFYLALVLTVSRLFADQELTVLLAGGIGPNRVLGWLLVSATLIAAVVGWLSFHVTPAMEQKRAVFMLEQRMAQEFDGLMEGAFQTFSGGDGVAYAGTVSDDRRRLHDVFMADERGGNGNVTIWAETGSQYVDERTGSRFLLLENGRRYEGTPGSSDYRVVTFAAMGQRIEQRDPVLDRLRVQSMGTRALLDAPTPEHMSELHWRVAMPMMTLLVAVVGFGLARAKPRQGRFATLVPALLAVLGYYLMLLLNQHLLLNAQLPLAAGLWPAHLMALGLGLWLVRRLGKPA